jgi:UDP-N-acetylglucosamine diphosphorylase/glucosamine-1-phosphate N-acetyltransferase
MQLILFDHPTYSEALLPFTFTRPISGLRMGILTLKEKWEKHLGMEAGVWAQAPVGNYVNTPLRDEVLLVCSSLLPAASWMEQLKQLPPATALLDEQSQVCALRLNQQEATNFLQSFIWTGAQQQLHGERHWVTQPWHLFKGNGREIRADFDLITRNRKSAKLSDPHTIVYGEENLFIEEGAEIKAAVINAASGPVYIGRNAQIHEGVLIHGPLALCEGAHLNMGAKIRGDSTIGPYCKVGGEVSNAILFGFSNKAHDGFLGNSVIGEWCNLGADTNTSNLKNNYAEVRLWSYASQRFEPTGEQFCGLMMGDHSKCSINTMFNTGTVVGVGANIFGSGFPRNFIPSFTWGGAGGMTTYKIQKFFESAEAMMARRGTNLSEQDKALYQEIFDLSAKSRD